MNADTKKKFVNEILKFLDTPYRWGGSTERGVDCSGLVCALYKRCANIYLPHSTKEIYKFGTPVAKESLIFGDLLFFNTKSGYIPNHVGLYLAKDKFLHASTTRGVTIDNFNKNPYKVQFIGIRRIIR